MIIPFLDKSPLRAAFAMPDSLIVAVLENLAIAVNGIPDPSSPKNMILPDWIFKSSDNMSWVYEFARHLKREITIRDISLVGAGAPDDFEETYNLMLRTLQKNADKGDYNSATPPPKDYFNLMIEKVMGNDIQNVSPPKNVVELCRLDLKTDQTYNLQYTIRTPPAFLTGMEVPKPAPEPEKKPIVTSTPFKSPEDTLKPDPTKLASMMRDLTGNAIRKIDEKRAS